MLVVGSAESGKTTFAHSLIKHAASKPHSLRAMLLDADPAHSIASAPACIGLCTPILGEPRVERRSFEARAHIFVGTPFVAGYALEMLSAMRRLAVSATPNDMLVVDTPSWVYGVEARRFLQAAVTILGASHIVALCRGSEMDAILAPFARRRDMRVHRHAIAPGIQSKPSSFRANRLAVRFASSLEGSELHSFGFNACSFSNTWLGAGSVLPPHLMKYLATAISEEAHLFYAETYGRHLGMIVNRRLSQESTALSIAMEQLGVKEVTVTPATLLKHLIVGLETDTGKFIGTGRIEAIDFVRQTIGISSPVRSAASVNHLRFGCVRVSEQGQILGRIAPGEI